MGENSCVRKYRRAQLESNEFCSKRKLGPIVGTTSNEASETENQIKTLLSPHKQKSSEGQESDKGGRKVDRVSGKRPPHYLLLSTKGSRLVDVQGSEKYSRHKLYSPDCNHVSMFIVHLILTCYLDSDTPNDRASFWTKRDTCSSSLEHSLERASTCTSWL